MISRILAEEGIPQELIHLAQAESGFLPRAVSRAAADGHVAVREVPRQRYGLKQTPYSDERLDPEKATRAAAHHLHDLYNEFGDWYLAIAAYNCGPGGVENALSSAPATPISGNCARAARCPTETTNYVPIILAMTIMAKNAPEYGLDQITPDAPRRVRHHRHHFAHQSCSDQRSDRYAVLGTASVESGAAAQYRAGEFRNPCAEGHWRTGHGRAGSGAGRTARFLARAPRASRVRASPSIARLYSASASQIAVANKLDRRRTRRGRPPVVPAAYHEAVPRAADAATQSGSEDPAHGSCCIHEDAGAPLRTPAAAAAPAKRPLHHPTTGTLAQLKDHNRVFPEPLISSVSSLSRLRFYAPLRDFDVHPILAQKTKRGMLMETVPKQETDWMFDDLKFAPKDEDEMEDFRDYGDESDDLDSKLDDYEDDEDEDEDEDEIVAAVAVDASPKS